MHQVDAEGLEPGKAHIKGAALHLRVGEAEGVGVAVGADLVHIDAAGIGEAGGPGDLVKALAGGIVPGAADDGEVGVVGDIDDVGVPAGHHQAEEGGSRSGWAM